jgi:flagellar protein FliO/FliZ
MSLLANTGLLQGAPESEPLWSGGGTLSLLVVMLVLMVGAVVAVWVFVQRGGMPRRKGTGNLNLLETRVLGGRQYLVVAEYGSQRFLLGVCPGKIDYLCALDTEPCDDDAQDFAKVMSQHGSSNE